MRALAIFGYLGARSWSGYNWTFWGLVVGRGGPLFWVVCEFCFLFLLLLTWRFFCMAADCFCCATVASSEFFLGCWLVVFLLRLFCFAGPVFFFCMFVVFCQRSFTGTSPELHFIVFFVVRRFLV